jgi:DNA-directed RNA polymerase I, II, and III subunit RPABC2
MMSTISTHYKYLTKYEKANILGTRALQISKNAKIFVEIDENMIDPYEIALKELNEGKCPMKVRRYINETDYEEIDVADLIMLK